MATPALQRPQLCYHVRQGIGGTFNIPLPRFTDTKTDQPEHVTALTTSGCKTCVGVYFRIDNSQCFTAHIDAQVPRHDGELDDSHFRCADPTGARLTQAVTAAIKQTVGENWQPDTATKGSLIITCPRLKNDHIREEEEEVGFKLTGFFIAKAFFDLFGVDDSQLQEAPGFVVIPQSHNVTILAWKTGAEAGNWQTAADIGYDRRLPDEDQLSSWSFVEDSGGWVVQPRDSEIRALQRQVHGMDG